MVLVGQLLRASSKLAAQSLKPLPKGHPEATKPLYVNGYRVFPPTIDESGNVTYYQEFPMGWKPYSMNYIGHGWLVGSQILLWLGLYIYYESSTKRKNL